MNAFVTRDTRLNPHPHPHSEMQVQTFGRITLLQRAKWDLAVLEELAKPGNMELTPVFDMGGEVIDFMWLKASPTSTLAFGCTGEDLAGRLLK